MPKFEDLDSRFSKTNIRFEISTSEGDTCKILLKLESWYFLAQNAHIWGDSGSKFSKTNVIFKISTCQIEYRQNFVERLESLNVLAQNAQICAFGLEIWKTKASRKFQISPVWKFWIVSGRFTFFLSRSGFIKQET